MQRTFSESKRRSALGAANGVLLTLASVVLPVLVHGAPFTVARDAKPHSPIVIHPAATAPVRAAAETLRATLSVMVGNPFAIEPGTGTTGIVVGTVAEFAPLATGVPFRPTDLSGREDLLLRSSDKRLLVLGATPAAVMHAVWTLLDQLGYRQFFPGPTWEIVPHRPSLELDIDRFEHPDYVTRMIWPGFGNWPENAAEYEQWRVRNRLGGGLQLRSGHAYDGIIARNRSAFDADPTLFPLVNGRRCGPKLNIPNPALRQLVIDDALEQFRRQPTLDSISLEPSDGGGWGDLKDARYGGISTLVIQLANEVAEAVCVEFGDKLVGVYAYNEHADPPAIAVHSNVVVSLATTFGGNMPMEDRMVGWAARGAQLGIREYYSVAVWDRDLPGRPVASRLSALRDTIPRYHALGARFMSAESGANFGPAGLGYYLAARMLWDVKEAGRMEARLDEFYTLAFGAAEAPMRRFYGLMMPETGRPLLSADLLGRMYRALAEARAAAAAEPTVLARIGELVLYARYVDLYRQYEQADDDARQAAFEAVVQHAYRMRRTHMVHSLALYRDLPRRDGRVTVPPGAAWNDPAPGNPWKSDKPFTPEMLDRFVRDGIATCPLRGFEPVGFSDDLVPVDATCFPNVPPAQERVVAVRGTARCLYTWVEPGQSTVELQLTAGDVYAGGQVQVVLFAAANPLLDAVARAEITADRHPHTVRLPTAFSGLHRIEVTDHGALTRIVWPEGMRMTHVETPDRLTQAYHRHSRYVYVPKGTRVVGGYATRGGDIYDGSGNRVHRFSGAASYFAIPVPPGEDGCLWRLDRNAGDRFFMTIPPYLARTPAELLLPAEVVRADGLGTGPLSETHGRGAHPK